MTTEGETSSYIVASFENIVLKIAKARKDKQT